MCPGRWSTAVTRASPSAASHPFSAPLDCCRNCCDTGTIARIGMTASVERQGADARELPVGVYRYPEMDSVAFGGAWQDALVKEVARIGAQRAFVLAGTSLASAASLEG